MSGVRRIAVLLGVADSAKEFRESFEDSKKALVPLTGFEPVDQ